MRRSPRLERRAPGAPTPYRCDDYGHCKADRNGLPNRICDPNAPFTCPGLAPDSTPRSHNGMVHPVPSTVRVCRRCVNHDENISLRDRVKNPDRIVAPNGFRGQLCHRCIRDEVALYWRRSGTPRPQGPASMAMIQSWPVVAGGTQNLCICEEKAITPYQHHCHACRDEAFINNALEDRQLANDILRNRVKPVIKGEKKCLSNGGREPLRVRASQITKRARQPHRIARMCPCGGRPKAPTVPPTAEYITVCMACMGVKVVSRNLPPDLREGQFGRTFSTRAGRVGAQTKGPKRANRSHLFRVNIERGWVDNDPLVGGTY